MVLRRALWRCGFRYVVHARDLPGRPDVVFRGPRVAVFVDGDFWHGRLLCEGQREEFEAQFRVRREWWVAKIQRNVQRDQEVTQQLAASGWRVLRVWESEVRKSLDDVVGRVAALVRATR